MLHSSKTVEDVLSHLQSEVLGMYSKGFSYAHISKEMALTEHSIAVILHSAVGALEARNVTHAISLYFNK